MEREKKSCQVCFHDATDVVGNNAVTGWRSDVWEREQGPWENDLMHGDDGVKVEKDGRT